MIDAITKRWIRTRADETAAEQGCRFVAAKAERVRSFFRKFLRHSKGEWAGQPFELLEWQWTDIFAPVFGWMRPDGFRRFRIAYVEIPKKNGKSTIASGIGLYLLVGDGEQGAEVYSLGSTREQAAVVHDEAINMVKASKGLSAYLKLNPSTGAIFFPRTKSYYKTLAFGGDASHGKNANGLLTDELHAWKGNAGRAFHGAMEFAGAARRQPLNFKITTAGDDPATVCKEQHDYALDIIKGRNKEDTEFFGYVRAADPEDNLDDPAIWGKANPSLGTTIRADDFGNALRRAKAKPSSWNEFKQLRFNIWTTGSNPALSTDDWSACEADFDRELLEGKECWLGLDLSRTRDMTAVALVFKGDADGEYFVLVWFWIPRGTLEKPETPKEFHAWAEAGLIFVTDGPVTDYTAVEDFIALELAEKFVILDMAFDPHFAEELTQRIADRTAIARVQFDQTMTNFAAPTAEFERLVIAHKLRHNGCPVLAWQAGNVEFATDRNNNKRPVKPGGREVKKIDGIVAIIEALARAMRYQGGEIGCSA